MTARQIQAEALDLMADPTADLEHAQAQRIEAQRIEQPVGGMTSSATADDGLPGKEGSFLACAFWLIENLCYLGEVEEARERFEELLAFASPLGLYSEELDPNSGEQIGNYPQAFTHIGLINTAITLQQAQEGTLRARPEISGAQ